MRASYSIALAAFLGPWSIAHAQPVDCRTGLEAFDKKNYAEAVSFLNKCLELRLRDGPRAFVLRVRGQAQWELKNPEQALYDQKESLTLEKPKDGWPLIMLAVYHRELKQYSESLAALKEAEKYDEDGTGTGPGMAVFYHTGWTLHEAGRYAEAIEAYTKGIPKQPDYGWALYRRALAYEALGNRDQAKRDLFRATELAPKDGYEPEIVMKLREYGFDAKVRKD